MTFISGKSLQSRGFTLIELLVVISVIGVLSSIIMASLNTARNKAKDAAIKELAMQMRNVYEIEMLNKGSYAGLKNPSYSLTCSNSSGIYSCLISSTAQCTSFYLSGTEGEKICLDILNKGSTSFSVGTDSADMFTGKYGIYIPFPSNLTGNGRCIGSSGGVTDQQNTAACFLTGVAW